MPAIIEKEYKVKAKDVFLTVIIGEGQEGTPTAELDGGLLLTGKIDKHPLGSGEDLVGKTLVVYAPVSHTNPNTNRASLKCVLRGGAAKRTFTARATFKDGIDEIDLEATIHLVTTEPEE